MKATPKQREVPPKQRSTGELGDVLGVQSWCISRLFEDGTLAEPPRIAGRRVIDNSLIPDIVDALRARGWMPARDVEAE